MQMPLINIVLLPCYCFSSGEEIQKISVLTGLPDLLQTNLDDSLNRIVPKVREMISISSIELQATAAQYVISHLS